MAKLIRSGFRHLDHLSWVRDEYDDGTVITEGYAPDDTKAWKGFWPNHDPVVRDGQDVAGWQFCFSSRSELEATMGREGYGPRADAASFSSAKMDAKQWDERLHGSSR
jgi:hypothetical protein